MFDLLLTYFKFLGVLGAVARSARHKIRLLSVAAGVATAEDAAMDLHPTCPWEGILGASIKGALKTQAFATITISCVKRGIPWKKFLFCQ